MLYYWRKTEETAVLGNTRHINIRYFWIKGIAECGDINIEYTPTHLMLADYFTKPLSGTQFKKLTNNGTNLRRKCTQN